MNSRHVYIGNYYSFSTPSSKSRVSAVGGFFFYVFHEIFPKYREVNQHKVTDASALIGARLYGGRGSNPLGRVAHYIELVYTKEEGQTLVRPLSYVAALFFFI
jgi:hypothetical protein